MFIAIYKLLITALFPLINATYIAKRRRLKKEPQDERYDERIANYTHPRLKGKLYWFHGASVGEAISMLPLIEKLLNEDEELSIMVTTGTLTSAEIMEQRLPKRAFHQYICYDVPMFAKRLLDYYKPDAVLWFESELWPALLDEVHKRKIPLILVNGRISDKSYKIWKKFKFAARELLGCFSLCLGQSEQDKNRLKFLGARRTGCFGNIKYAGVPLPVDEAKLNQLNELIMGRPVFCLSSTHDNEEAQLGAHMRYIQQHVPQILFLVVPRHPNRGANIKQVFDKLGFRTALRSDGDEPNKDVEVYIADTIGEMGLWYKLSTVVFVGGSLVRHGGQNVMEPARDQCAVIVGPYMYNFSEMMSRAQAAGAVWQVQSAEAVADEAVKLFDNPELLEERQAKAYFWTEKESQVLEGISQVLKQELK